VTEVITSSRDPDQGQRGPLRPPPVLLAALIVAVTVVGFLATRGDGGSPRHHEATGPTGAPTGAPSYAPFQVAPALGPTAPAALRCGQHCDTAVLHGRAGNGPRGMHLLVNTVPLTVLDASGQRHPGPRIPLRHGEHVQTLLPMGDESAALVLADDPTDSSRPGRVYRLAPTGTAVQIGRADDLIQGVGATVWTITYPRQGTGTGPLTLAEIDPSGRVLVSLSESDGTQALRATSAGLLATLPVRSTGEFLTPMTLVLLDPRTGDVDHVLSSRVVAVLDATDTTVAWSTARSDVVVYDLEHENRPVVFHAGGFLPPNYGRFSPDRRTLALGVTGLPQIGTNPASFGYLDILDVRNGRTTRIKGLRYPPKIDPQLDWSDDGDVLILGVDNGKRGRIAFWHRQSHLVTVLPEAVPNSDNYRFVYLQLTG
jgi:hypothetical protein